MKRIFIILVAALLITGCSFIEETKEKTMAEISNWCNETMIDNGLNEIKDYLTSKASDIDVEQTLSQLESSITQLKEYNEEMQLVDDQEIKDAWDKLYNEMIKNYNLVKDKDLDSSTSIKGFDTTKLEQYQKEFEELISQKSE